MTDRMRCAACGYRHRPEIVHEYKEAVLYQSGKNKGKFKQVRSAQFIVQGTPPFRRICIGREDYDLTAPDMDIPEHDTRVVLYACPECGTVRIEG